MSSVTVAGPIAVSGAVGDVLGLAAVSGAVGDVLGLAAQINALLEADLAGSPPTLAASDGTFSGIPAAPFVSQPTVAGLALNGSGGSAAIPAGYSYVVVNATGANTVTGSNLALNTGTTGGAFYVTGQSTVAAEGGDNLIADSGLYLISTAPGNDTISASGFGTVATDLGANLIGVSGYNMVMSFGQDTIVAGAGLTTVDSSGSQSFVAGSSAGQTFLAVSVSGSQTTVSAATSDTTVTLAGSNDWVFGGQTGDGTLSVLDMGSNDSVAGMSTPTTVTAGGDSNGLYVFGGAGNLSFEGYNPSAGTWVTGAATVLSGTGMNDIFGEGGGLLLGAYGNNDVFGQAPGATIFGTDGSIVTYYTDSTSEFWYDGITVSPTPGDLTHAAGLGNETLNAAYSWGTDALFAVGPSNASIAGGFGTNLFDAGAGSDTFTGGTGSNTYFFLAANTAGSHDFVTNLSASDAVGLIGYNPATSTVTVANGSATLTLSNNTEITFVNVTNITNNIHYG
ncbi:MAG: hypothetical protein ABSC06_07405 [Rhodopila sp.]|jgi:hypothetical protein